jgi:hypothetical protein
MVGGTGKEARWLIGFSSPVFCYQAQVRRGNSKFKKYPAEKLYAVLARNYRSAIQSNQVFPARISCQIR